MRRQSRRKKLNLLPGGDAYGGEEPGGGEEAHRRAAQAHPLPQLPLLRAQRPRNQRRRVRRPDAGAAAS